MAVAIPYDVQPDGSVLVCLVSSRKHDGKFVLPKGGVEKGEESREAALREMWEEGELGGGCYGPPMPRPAAERGAHTSLHG